MKEFEIIKINNYNDVCGKMMFFPHNKKTQINEAIDRIDILIDLMGFKKRWLYPYIGGQISLSFKYNLSTEFAIVFYLNKKNIVNAIRIFCSGTEKPIREVGVNKRNFKHVLRVINEFEAMI